MINTPEAKIGKGFGLSPLQHKTQQQSNNSQYPLPSALAVVKTSDLILIKAQCHTSPHIDASRLTAPFSPLSPDDKKCQKHTRPTCTQFQLFESRGPSVVAALPTSKP